MTTDLTDLTELSRVGHYTAGMPQLCWNGLSENWLLKECGHRHWMAMADEQGQSQPEFYDAQGRKVYAAFTFIRISAAALYKVQEHSRFSITTSHCEIGRAQDYSRHELVTGGRRAACIEMLSAYIRRDAVGDNRSVVRAALDRSGHAHQSSGLTAQAELFVQHARTCRGSASFSDTADAAGTADDAFESTFTPCPNNDFNGAALLYFSSFQSMVDRAEWEHRYALQLQPHAQFDLHREITFKGNLNLGDTVHIKMQAQRHGDGGLSHTSILHRQSDGMAVASLRTTKAKAS